MASSDKSKKQVMDVSKPGKAAANASSRPVIVGHGPLVQDPMVTSDEDNKEPKETSEKLTSPANSKRIIAPLSETEKESDTEEVSVPESTSEAETVGETEPAEEATPETDEAVVEETPEKPVEPETADPSADSAVVDAVIDQVGDKKKDEIEAEEERKRQESIDKLVAAKKYFVPIGKVHKKSSRIWLTLTLLLLLVLLGLVAAIDAEILESSITLPFDLIR